MTFDALIFKKSDPKGSLFLWIESGIIFVNKRVKNLLEKVLQNWDKSRRLFFMDEKKKHKV
jgi:hypothetical protein